MPSYLISKAAFLIVADSNPSWHRTVVAVWYASLLTAPQRWLCSPDTLTSVLESLNASPSWRRAPSCSAFCSRVHLDLDRKAECSWEKKREEILVHSLFSAIMNTLSGRIHQRSLWGEKMSGKVMVCWLLTHVALPRKVIEVQKMSCCCTSSICIAVSQDK